MSESGRTCEFTLADGSRLIALHDGVFEPGTENLVDLAGEDETAALRRLPAPRFDVNAYVLERDGAMVLIDAGAGAAFGPGFGGVWRGLESLGIGFDQVRTVLLTHPHGDHAMGLVGEDGSAKFANATVFCPRNDVDFFSSERAREAAGPARAQAFGAARAAFAAVGDGLRPFETGELMPGIEAVSLPGHTPGHCGFLIGGKTLIWGDVVHMADRQPQRPTICTVFDTDPGWRWARGGRCSRWRRNGSSTCSGCTRRSAGGGACWSTGTVSR